MKITMETNAASPHISKYTFCDNSDSLSSGTIVNIPTEVNCNVKMTGKYLHKGQ